jgi:hypothetical protein
MAQKAQFNSIQFIQLISKHIGDNILYIYTLIS